MPECNNGCFPSFFENGFKSFKKGLGAVTDLDREGGEVGDGDVDVDVEEEDEDGVGGLFWSLNGLESCVVS